MEHIRGKMEMKQTYEKNTEAVQIALNAKKHENPRTKIKRNKKKEKSEKWNEHMRNIAKQNAQFSCIPSLPFFFRFVYFFLRMFLAFRFHFIYFCSLLFCFSFTFFQTCSAKS